MLQLALRTDSEFDAVKAVIVASDYSGFAVREVAGDNEHWHWYLEGDKYKTIRSFRTILLRKVPALVGNAGYSLKACDEKYENYWKYMCKGDSEGHGPNIAWSHGLLFSLNRLW